MEHQSVAERCGAVQDGKSRRPKLSCVFPGHEDGPGSTKLRCLHLLGCERSKCYSLYKQSKITFPITSCKYERCFKARWWYRRWAVCGTVYIPTGSIETYNLLLHMGCEVNAGQGGNVGQKGREGERDGWMGGRGLTENEKVR